jgi:hypothetical protein
MTFDWQDVVALTVVFAAVASLARRAWRTMSARQPATGCTHCSACSSGSGEQQLVKVTLAMPSAAPSFNR